MLKVGIVEKVESIHKRYIESFEELDVYQLAFELSIEVHKASLDFPKMEQYALADQVRRASKGICANIAEGFGKQRYSQAEFRRFLMMALGSANEMRVWVRYAQELGYVDSGIAERWREEYLRVAKMLGSLSAKR